MHICREGIRDVMSIDAELHMLQTYIIRGWVQTKDDLEPAVWEYWPITDKLAISDNVAMESKGIIIPFSLQVKSHVHRKDMATHMGFNILE